MKLTLALITALLVAGLSAPAHANHGDGTEMTDDTPYTLADGEWKIGLWKVEYGLPGRLNDLQIGTYTIYYTPWLVGARLINFHAKYELWSNPRWTVSTSLGLFYMDLENLTDTPVTFSLMPFEIGAAYQLTDSLILGGRTVLTGMGIEGSYDSDEIGGLQGAVAASSGQLIGSLTWRWGPVTAFMFETRASRFFGASASAKSTVRIDDYTTLDVFAAGQADLSGFTGSSMTGRVHFAWKKFNLRLGLTYGNYVFGGINFIVPARIPFPEFDIHWRF